MKSTLTEALEFELNIAPIDLRIEELQQMEAIKFLQKRINLSPAALAKK